MRRTVAMIFMLALCVACAQTTKRSSPEAKQRLSFSSVGSDSSVFPLADGGAFLVDADSQPPAVYYLRDERAARVKTTASRHWPLPDGFKPSSRKPDIYPLADGTAYLVTSGYPVEIFHLTRTKKVLGGPSGVRAEPVGVQLLSGALQPKLSGSQADVYPLADGTAYLVLDRTMTARDLAAEGERVEIFHLTGAKAVRVRETSTLPGTEGFVPLRDEGAAAPTKSSFAWATLQSHITKRQRDEREAQDAEEAAEERRREQDQ